MANIAISELNTEVTRISNDDLLLVSKYNSNGTFTSAKIKAQNVGDTSKRITTDANEIVVYISPTGSDNNIDSQYLNFGKDTQSNYPLFTITQACKLIGKILQLESSGRHAIIKCYAGTYNYTQAQIVFGSYNQWGNYIRIEPLNDYQNVVFNQNYDSGNQRNYVFITTYCNTVFRKISVIGNSNWRTHLQNGEYSHGIVAANCSITFYGVELSSFMTAAQTNNCSTLYIRSDYTNQGTLENIETNHTPTYIHDCLYAINGYNNQNIDLSGWIRINCDNAINFDNSGIIRIGSSSNVSGSSYIISRIDIKVATKVVSYSYYNLPSGLIVSGTPQTFVMNIFKQGVTYSSIAEAFEVEEINVQNPSKSCNVLIGNNIQSKINLNVDKF